MSSVNFEQLEAELRTLGETKGILSIRKKQAIRDRVFQSIGQVELADAIATGRTKAGLAVSLKHLQQALIPHRLSFSMPVTLATVIVVFVSSIVTGAAAQSSQPGDVLFNVKKALETLELAVVSNPTKKAEMSLNIAGERLQYLEQSVGKEEALHTVLQETQSALVSAQTSLKNAEGTGDEKEAAALLDKFNSLLSAQKTILDDIEKTEPSDDIKQTIVAIRDAIENKSAEDKAKEVIDLTKKATVVPATSATPTGKSGEKPTTTGEPQPLSDGLHNIVVRIGTAYSKPAVYINNYYYEVVASPIDLQPYIGYTNVLVLGDVQGKTITIRRVIIDGMLNGEAITEPTEETQL